MVEFCPQDSTIFPKAGILRSMRHSTPSAAQEVTDGSERGAVYAAPRPSRASTAREVGFNRAADAWHGPGVLPTSPPTGNPAMSADAPTPMSSSGPHPTAARPASTPPPTPAAPPRRSPAPRSRAARRR